MNFFQNFKDTFYNPAFYKSVKDEKFLTGFKYFITLVVFVAMIVAFRFGISAAPLFSRDSLRSFVSFYPQELSIELKNGSITTNVSEPYFIKDKSGVTVKGRIHSNILVIDTKKDFSLDAFKEYDTEVWLGKNYLVMSKNGGRFEITDLSRVPDFVINQNKIYSLVDFIASYHWLISIGIFVSVFIMFLVLFTILSMLLLLVISLIALLTKRFTKIQYNFGNFYISGLYAVTPAVVVHVLGIISGVGNSNLIFIAITLAVLYFNLKPTNEQLPNIN